MKVPWYQMKTKADAPNVAEVHILDAIYSSDPWGDGSVTPKSFLRDLAALPEGVDTVRVRINSPGGDVFAASTIANALRDQAKKGRTVETVVDGLAASAATLIMMAGSKVTVADNAMVMVHNPYSIVVGNAAEMRKTAEALDAIRGTIVATYQWHSPLSEAELVAMLDAETWMDADEAIANGFATDKVEGLRAVASIDPAHLAKLQVPERFTARLDALAAKVEPPAVEPPAPVVEPPVVEASATSEDILSMCVAAGLDAAFALDLTKAKATPAGAAQLVSAEKVRRAAELARQDEIRALCTKAKVPTLANDFIAGGMTFDAARAAVGRITALMDKAEIDAGLKPDAGTPRRVVIDVRDVYAGRRKPLSN